MKKIDIKASLNDKQYEAAAKIEGPVLIIAGAGSGKTRMITYRIAHMIKNCNIKPENILALTFTNKAATEMQERIQELTGLSLKKLTVGTFHSFGVGVLKNNIQTLGFGNNFSIYDQTDQVSAIKDAARELKMSIDALNMFELCSLFSGIKTQRFEWTPADAIYKELYELYLRRLKAYNAVDFDDLITLPIDIFEANPEILEKYRDKYQFILVDEFQDTSLIQYKMVKILAEKNRNICVVGDDDQSIYSWRGANYENIESYEKDFPELLEIRLEQNYRSTKNILEAANKVIENNSNRKDKKLWTGDGDGKSIEIFYPNDEAKEAQFIATTIRKLKLGTNLKYSDFGILIRTNTLCSTIEEFFLEENIPYNISGGSSFFQRKEVRDMIAFMKLISNLDDDINLLRIINTPRRGIGIVSVEKIRMIAKNNKCSIFSALKLLSISKDAGDHFRQSVKCEIEDFVTLIENYVEEFANPGKNLYVTLQKLVTELHYIPHIMHEYKDKEKLAKFKINNVNKFIQMVERWESNGDNFSLTLEAFLNRISIISGDDKKEDEDDKVNLMTIHASKGLEFEVVFMAGVEDKIIPHQRSIEEDPKNIEEERRLFYVAITRARKHLFLLSCQNRRTFQGNKPAYPSPFIEEIPKELMIYHNEDEVNPEFDASAFLNSLAQNCLSDN